MFGRPLGSAMPMRSPRFTPDAASASATAWICLRNPPYVIRMFCSGAITAVWSAGIAWIKPSSVFEAIDAPSEGVIDVLLVRPRRVRGQRRSVASPYGAKAEILQSDPILLQLAIPETGIMRTSP